MRAVVFCLCLLPLALGTPVAPAPQQENVEDAGPHLDLVEMMHSLFTDRSERAITEDNEEADEASKVTKRDMLPTVKDSAKIREYNQMVDDIYKKMNMMLRSQNMDPMVLNIDKARARLTKQQEKKDEKKKKHEKKHSMGKREAEEVELVEDEEEDEVDEVVAVEEGEARKMNPKHKVQKKGHKNADKKKKGHKKNDKKDEKKKGNKKDKDEKNKGNKKDKDDKNKGDKKDKDEKKKGNNKHKDEKKKQHHKKNKDEKKNHNNKHKKDEKKEHHKKNKDEKKNHHNKNKAHGKHKSKRNADVKTTEMGSLSGMASLERIGDVKVFKGDKFKIVESDFSLGPLNLEVTKSHGGSKNVKVARAVTEKLKGEMVIKISDDGNTHIKSVKFEKAKKVDVLASLGLVAKDSKKLAERSMSRLRPVAAQRLLKLARSIIKNKTNVEKQ